MKYQIVGKNIEVTEGISGAIKNKLSRMEKYFLVKDEVECRAVISAYKGSQKIEVTIFLPNDMTLRAEVSEPDLYAAIDLAVDKLEGQMRKVKTRMDRSGNKLSLGRSIDFEQVKNEEKDEEDVIVRAKSYYLTAMTIEEAVTRMEALGHDFFLYLDKEDDHISVVYKRKDGGYGVIQAENEVK